MHAWLLAMWLVSAPTVNVEDLDVYCTPDKAMPIHVDAAELARAADVAYDPVAHVLLVYRSRGMRQTLATFDTRGNPLRTWTIPEQYAAWSVTFVRDKNLCVIALDKSRSVQDSHSSGYVERQDVILMFPEDGSRATLRQDVMYDDAFDRSLDPRSTDLIRGVLRSADIPTGGSGSLSSSSEITLHYDPSEVRLHAARINPPVAWSANLRVIAFGFMGLEHYSIAKQMPGSHWDIAPVGGLLRSALRSHFGSTYEADATLNAIAVQERIAAFGFRDWSSNNGPGAVVWLDISGVSPRLLRTAHGILARRLERY